MNRLNRQNNVYAQGGAQEKILSNFEYSLSLDGKRNKLEEEVLNPEAVNGKPTSVAKSNRTLSYDYNLSNRLTQEKREERQSLRAGGEAPSTRTTSFAYDAVGNRIGEVAKSYTGVGTNAILGNIFAAHNPTGACGIDVRPNAKTADVRGVPRLDENRLPDAARCRVPVPLLADRLLFVVHWVFNAKDQNRAARSVRQRFQGVRQVELERVVAAFVMPQVDAVAPAIGEKIRRANC